jgi:hypothetical protein
LAEGGLAEVAAIEAVLRVVGLVETRLRIDVSLVVQLGLRLVRLTDASGQGTTLS